MTPETNKIRKIAPRVYSVTLWCPESSLLQQLLDPAPSYVLCWDHNTMGADGWGVFKLPLFDPLEPISVYSRMANFDFVLPTKQFLDILPRLTPAIKAVQLSILPPAYLDMRSIRGKQLFRILGECGWHLFLDTPANDFCTLMSPEPTLLERAIELVGKEES